MANIRLTLQRTTAPQLFPSRKYVLRYSSKMIAGTGGGPSLHYSRKLQLENRRKNKHMV